MFSRWGAIELLLSLLFVFTFEPPLSTAETIDFFDMGFDNPLGSIWNNRQVIGEERPLNRYDCVSNENDNRNGICMKTTSCRYQGGISTGRSTCGMWNTCCVFEVTSNQTSSARVTYFRNPMNARGKGTKQRVRIQLKPEVCQVRVDIRSMNIIEPTFTQAAIAPRVITSRCDKDFLEVEPQSGYLPDICGKNRDQHFYVHLAQGSSTFMLSINLDQSPGQTIVAQWDIKITQLECPAYRGTFNKQFRDDHNQLMSDFYQLAPRGCLQYFTESNGEFHNFGFMGDMDSTLTTEQDYAICFKRQPGSCGIKFTTVSLNMRDVDTATNQCGNDYISIPEDKKYCASTVGEPSLPYIRPGPLYVRVYSNMPTTYAGPGYARFQFRYDMASCPY